MIPNTESSITLADIPESLIKSILENKDIAIFFDKSLNYMVVNQPTCKHLNKTPEELVGKCILDLYPGIIASNNHRNLLKALEGETIKDSVILSITGKLLYCFYEPIYINGNLIGVTLTAKQTASQNQ